MSIKINHINGLEGQIDLAGIRAVVGIFYRWVLERRGEDDAGDPRWTLRAYFSYQKPGMLLNPKYRQTIRVKVPPGDHWYIVEPTEGPPVIDSDGILRLEGAKLCPAQPPTTRSQQ